jgi:hypothetical protein
MRPLFAAVFLIALLAACTTPTTPATTTGAAEGTTSGDPTTTVNEAFPSPTTTVGSPGTTTTTTPTAALFVVAEERMGRLTVLEETGGRPCGADEPAPCGPVEILTSIDLQYRPHNMTSAGAILWVTHPSEGRVTRIDLVDLTVVSQPLGVEPHDVKASNAGDILYVADEEGRAIILADPDTLEELGRIRTPARPHDLAVDSDGTVWLTLIGDDRLGWLRDGNLELFPTGRAPHDLLPTPDGRIWFSNWNSAELATFDPATGVTIEAPSGVTEPQHFAIDSAGDIWVSDIGDSSVVSFVEDGPTTITVGLAPHHLVFGSGIGVVAVSGSGQAVFVDQNGVVGRIDLTTGLHGVAVVLVGQ